MAVQPITYKQLESIYGHTHLVLWAAMANGDSGAILNMSGSSDRSVHVYGTFGAGGTVVIEGSNEDPGSTPANYITLHDPSGSALSFTAAGIKTISEITANLRPRVTAGDGTTAIIVAIVAARVS